MKEYFVRYTKDPDKYSIVKAQNFPKALDYCKQFREDVIVCDMNALTITPNNFLQLRAQYKIEDIAHKTVYDLVYSLNGEMAHKLVECCEFNLEKACNEAFDIKDGKIFTFGIERILCKKKLGKPVPVCLIYKQGQRQTGLQFLKQ